MYKDNHRVIQHFTKANMGNLSVTSHKTKQAFGSDSSSIDTSVKKIVQAAEQAAQREAEKSVKKIGQAAEQAAKLEAEKWERCE